MYSTAKLGPRTRMKQVERRGKKKQLMEMILLLMEMIFSITSSYGIALKNSVFKNTKTVLIFVLKRRSEGKQERFKEISVVTTSRTQSWLKLHYITIVVLGSLFLQEKSSPSVVETMFFDAYQSKITCPQDSQIQAYVLPGTAVLGTYSCIFFKNEQKSCYQVFFLDFLNSNQDGSISKSVFKRC